MDDLLIIEAINHRLNDRFPVTYNNYLIGGYINMPSSRMGHPGELSFGYSWVHPYSIFSARCQFLNHLEITGNYRVFHGIEDKKLSKHGFGDLSDKGVNFKWAIWTPEESEYHLPGFAIGMEDILGTKAFNSTYFVLTHIFKCVNLELSFGYGMKRLKRWFGGVLWMPWRESCSFLRDIAFVAEWDATDYKNPKHEHHPDGRKRHGYINYGIKYRLWEMIDFSVSYVRGHKFSGSISAFYNFGETEGFLPKYEDPTPYLSPSVTEPIGRLRPEDALMTDLIYAFAEQGFTIHEGWLLADDEGERVLRLVIRNDRYYRETDIRHRIHHLLTYLTPSDISEVIVVMEEEDLLIHEYCYHWTELGRFHCRQMSIYEMDLLTPRREVSCLNPYNGRKLFALDDFEWELDISPKMKTLFGSSRGKFKFGAGINVGLSGYWRKIYYSFQLGYMPFITFSHCSDMDMLNPSQLLNVHSDALNYYKQKCVTIDELYIQRNWNLGYAGVCKGWFSRLSVGYFTQEYAGVAGELLYAPAHTCWAIGFEADGLRKRTVRGLGLSPVVRKLDGYKPTWRKFWGSQFFMDLYYDWKCAHIKFKVSAGQFLARDLGARLQVCRYFRSGLQVGLWYTWTDAHDVINCKTYHDMGVFVSMPLDILYPHRSRSVWQYWMSAWLRDCGYRTCTGTGLYDIIQALRHD